MYIMFKSYLTATSLEGLKPWQGYVLMHVWCLLRLWCFLQHVLLWLKKAVCPPWSLFLTSHPSLSPPLRKADGKAPTTGSADLPPEYLTSPLSQQSQVKKKQKSCLAQNKHMIWNIMRFLVSHHSIEKFHTWINWGYWESNDLDLPLSWSLTRCPPREMRQPCKRRRNCSWLLPFPKAKQRRRNGWWVSQLKSYLILSFNCL